MREFPEIDAVRWKLHEMQNPHEEISPRAIRYERPSQPWHISILTEYEELLDVCIETVREVEELYEQDISNRAESDGRVINPAYPVEINWGVLEVAQVLDRVEERFQRSEARIQLYNDKAEFGTGTEAEQAARSAITASQKVREITLLFLHSYLWLLWISESVAQAEQFAYLFAERGHFEQYDESVFSFVAHPPLVVATLSCTALTEEVGARYIQLHTDEHANTDNTSAKEVLKKISRSDDILSEYHVSTIIDQVCEKRDTMSHYITERYDLITIEGFYNYFPAILEGSAVVRQLLHSLILGVISGGESHDPEIPSVIDRIEEATDLDQAATHS